MSEFRLREAIAADHAAVLALNNAHTPHVNALSEEQFAWIAAHSGYFRIAEDAGGVSGFVLCVPSGHTEFWSENYKWFSARYEAFLYLDRVIVAPRMRRVGVGRALYADLHGRVPGVWPRVTLEVNLRPPNPVSIAFHEALGYVPVGVREYDDGRKAVQMFVREL